MDAGYNFGDTSFDASLLAKVCYIFTAFSNDYSSIFCAYKSAESERFLSSAGASGSRRRLWQFAASVLRRVRA